MRREVEDHVGVHGHEIRARLLNAFHDLLAAAVLFVAIHLLEQPVVEALHADGKAIDAPFQLLEITRNKMIRIGLGRHFLNGEVLARHIDRLAQLVDHDGGRAPADVDALKIVAQVLEHHHLFAHVGEIGFRALFLERESVERAIRAQALAERNVHIEHVALPGFRRNDLRIVGRRELQILVRARANHRAQHSFRKHILTSSLLFRLRNALIPRRNGRARPSRRCRCGTACPRS